MGKEVVLAVSLLVMLLAFNCVFAVEVKARGIAGSNETPVIEVSPLGSGSLCTVVSPSSNSIYDDNNILLNISSPKTLESITYKDSNDNHPTWKTLCTHCSGYDKEKLFKEGAHELSIKCTNSFGETETHKIEFFNDYTHPSISRTNPNSKFSNGLDFSIKYTEENVDSVLLLVRNVTLKNPNKPVIELFVMAHCPFSMQAEKGILPVIELLGNKVDFKIRYLDYAMHGEEEKKETFRQICIREEQSDKYYNYMECFWKDGNYSSCLASSKIDTRKLDQCFFNRAKDYYAKDVNISKENGITGTPTLIVNGAETEFAPRSSANSLRIICSKFNKIPDECFSCLSGENPFPGFGDYDAFNCQEEEFEGWIQKQCPSGKNQECSFNIDLKEFDGQEIEYFFAVRDIAGNLDISRPVKIKADTSDPVINNPFFWQQGTGKDKKYIYFEFNITETNFDEIIYSYEDNKGKLKQGILCSSLRYGICKTKKSFAPGDYILNLEILDKAGNSLKEKINFTI
jgi:hypothetical protein